MSKLIFSLMCVGFFAFFYLGVFSSNVEAGHVANSDAPGLVDCNLNAICGIDPPTTCPIMTAGRCLCPGASADCFGTAGDDIICGSNTGEEIFAGEGDDIVCAGGGADFLHGGWGCDDLQGEGGGDTLQGGHCADSHDGGSGTDTCRGGWGDDTAINCNTYKPGKTDDFKKHRGCISVICGNED